MFENLFSLLVTRHQVQMLSVVFFRDIMDVNPSLCKCAHLCVPCLKYENYCLSNLIRYYGFLTFRKTVVLPVSFVIITTHSKLHKVLFLALST